MPQDENQVRILFPDGYTLELTFVVRLVGADWIFGQKAEEDEYGQMTYKDVVLRSDQIRGIISDEVYHNDDGVIEYNSRIHLGKNLTPDDVPWDEMYKAQYQLHPNDDPSAFPDSEHQWPPEEEGAMSDTFDSVPNQ